MYISAGHEVKLILKSTTFDTRICDSQNIDKISDDHVIKTIHELEIKILHLTLTNDMQLALTLRDT